MVLPSNFPCSFAENKRRSDIATLTKRNLDYPSLQESGASAVNLLRSLGIGKPRVAVLAAGETVNSKMQATLDAAALTVMAARGQINGAVVDGPLAFDNAISAEAGRAKSIDYAVAGQADIFLVPDLEVGNMLAKQLIYFAGTHAAGPVLGARIPIIATSRADPLKVRTASAALAKLLAAAISDSP
ncbi:hypothetical protein KQ933_29715 (plasmid) [Rhizobium sp. WYJ-E13]|nr:hypothetical protein KQ933_29715 [Rhizobium sp. WYJ-E13]